MVSGIKLLEPRPVLRRSNCQSSEIVFPALGFQWPLLVLTCTLRLAFTHFGFFYFSIFYGLVVRKIGSSPGPRVKSSVKFTCRFVSSLSNETPSHTQVSQLLKRVLSNSVSSVSLFNLLSRVWSLKINPQNCCSVLCAPLLYSGVLVNKYSNHNQGIEFVEGQAYPAKTYTLYVVYVVYFSMGCNFKHLSYEKVKMYCTRVKWSSFTVYYSACGISSGLLWKMFQ